ncbi:MAG: malate dehydrogenase, partial [Candidatus Limnocylindria bacterium]
VRRLTSPAGPTFSAAVPSDGSYEVPEGIVFGYPLRTTDDGVEIVQGIEHGDFAGDKIRVTLNELIEERDAVQDLIG